MSGRYQRYNRQGHCWDLAWDEDKNQIRLQCPDTTMPMLIMTYDDARVVLDLLMAIFGRSELIYRYPEVR